MCTCINFDKAILIPADLNGSTLDQGVGMFFVNIQATGTQKGGG